jgi:hypothetical protein
MVTKGPMNMTRQFSESNRHLCEAGGSPLGCAVCPAGGFLSSNTVLTTKGWRFAGTLRDGDEVMTYGEGFVPIQQVVKTDSFSSRVPCPAHFWPLRIPAGVLDNQVPFLLLPDNSVLFDVEDDPEAEPALIPCRALMGRGGVTMEDPMQRQPVIALHFDRPQLVAVAGGAYVSCAGGELIDKAARVPVEMLGLSVARLAVSRRFPD